jgi:hypothetical protein
MRLEMQSRADWDHRCAACVDGFDDFSAVDALQIDRCHPQVAVAELAFDDDERNPFASHFDGVRVPQLVRGKSAPHTGRRGDASELGAHGGRGPMPPARRAGDDAQQRPDGQLARRAPRGRGARSLDPCSRMLAPSRCFSSPGSLQPACPVAVETEEFRSNVNRPARVPDQRD